jgi:hypothetical protein
VAQAAVRCRTISRDLVRDSGYWHDWMIAKLLHDEACGLLADAGAAPSRPRMHKERAEHRR